MADGVVARAEPVRLVERVRLLHLIVMSISTPRPGFSGTATLPPTICSGSRVSRWPSCQIQCVSIAVILPGAAAATCVNIASEMSK